MRKKEKIKGITVYVKDTFDKNQITRELFIPGGECYSIDFDGELTILRDDDIIIGHFNKDCYIGVACTWRYENGN